MPSIHPPCPPYTHHALHTPTMPFIHPPCPPYTHHALHTPTMPFIHPPCPPYTHHALHTPTMPSINSTCPPYTHHAPPPPYTHHARHDALGVFLWEDGCETNDSSLEDSAGRCNKTQWVGHNYLIKTCHSIFLTVVYYKTNYKTAILNMSIFMLVTISKDTIKYYSQ